jgi:hypothetical protein
MMPSYLICGVSGERPDRGHVGARACAVGGKRPVELERPGSIPCRDLPIEFGSEKLTSYAGLEVLTRFLRSIEFARRVCEAFARHPLGGDYGTRRMVLVVIGLLIVGGRRLKHLEYVASDEVFQRFCGLARIPAARTVALKLREVAYPSLYAEAA